MVDLGNPRLWRADAFLAAYEWFAQRAAIMPTSRRANRFAAFGPGSVLCFPPAALYGERAMTVDSTGNAITQGFAADVNLSADYRFSKRISIFLELNNLLSTNYQEWYNYRVRPFDVKAGVTVSF